MIGIAKVYEPAEVEGKWYRFWLEKGYFTAKIDRSKKPFVIIMPPPNVTGELHLGHALTATIEDVLTRWHRMKGDSALWLPGVDHAGIATQVVVENQLAKQGLTREGLGREKFVEKVWEWVGQCRQAIAYQHQRLGASCDWSRERFTLEDGPSRAVRTTFVRLYDKGLIYRGERLINWCPRCRTALSDLEVEHKELASHLYYLRYPLADGSGFITIATTRPETYLGDTAVAVNPEDGRWRELVGKKAVLPVINREIPIISDVAVDPAFGTGALKITPAHDPIDLEVAQRHHLAMINILNPDGTINENGGPYRGLDRFACREKVMEDFARLGLVDKVEPYSHSVGHCCRCQTMTEPLLSLQWFVRVAPLAGPAIRVVKDGQVRIIPERFQKTYLDWMDNIHDWCISRQLWWGHRIPVWYCRHCQKVTVAIDDPSACCHCGSPEISQDPDVLDTWFSSALWPHSTLGWPEKTEDLGYFYPTSIMETGYDILFFWVARMIMMGIENTGKPPFHTVYLHGLVRDEKGEKMSKLRGNVLNPTDAIEKYGADALRFAVTMGGSPGNDVNVGEPKLTAGRNYANKIWNSARFILSSMEERPEAVRPLPARHERYEDRWIMSRLAGLTREAGNLMDGFEFGEAETRMYDFFWKEFCDWYLEIAKIRLREGTEPSPLPVLAHVLERFLRLIHPFMPFISEEIWQRLVPGLVGRAGEKPESIVIAPYPEAGGSALDPEAERVMALVTEVIRSIRNVRSEYKIAPARQVEAIACVNDELLAAMRSQSRVVETLARVHPLVVTSADDRSAGGKAVRVALAEAEVVLPLATLVDVAQERARIEKEIDFQKRDISQLEQRLKDPLFLSRAPEAVVAREKSRLEAYRGRLDKARRELELLTRE